MLRSTVVRSYDSESLDDVLVSLQERGCSVTEVRSIELNTSHNNLSLKCNGFLILYDDPFVYQNMEKDEPDDEDLTNEEKFLRDWGRRPIHPNVVGSLAYEYVCPAITGLPFDQKLYNPETGLCSADQWLGSPSCIECAKRFWKSKYKKPEKKEV